MVDKITKFLKKLNRKDLEKVNQYIEHLLVRDFSGYDIRKLTSYENIFRMKRGRIRIIYHDDNKNEIRILKVSFRDEATYQDIALK